MRECAYTSIPRRSQNKGYPMVDPWFSHVTWRAQCTKHYLGLSARPYAYRTGISTLWGHMYARTPALCTTSVVKVFFLPVEPWETRTCTPDLTYPKVHLKSSVQFWYKNKKKSTMDIEGSKMSLVTRDTALKRPFRKNKKDNGKRLDQLFVLRDMTIALLWTCVRKN